MVNVQFCDVDELEEITGLTHEQLWDNYFDLDDCDAVMIIDEDALPLKFDESEFGYKYWTPVDDLYTLMYDGKLDRCLWDILESWENYCVGCHYTKYNGKIYVSKHHA